MVFMGPFAGGIMRICTIAIALFLVFGTYARASAPPAIDVKPGPTVMSPEELAIVADVAKGVQYGVVLIEETGP